MFIYDSIFSLCFSALHERNLWTSGLSQFPVSHVIRSHHNWNCQSPDASWLLPKQPVTILRFFFWINKSWTELQTNSLMSGYWRESVFFISHTAFGRKWCVYDGSCRNTSYMGAFYSRWKFCTVYKTNNSDKLNSSELYFVTCCFAWIKVNL